MSTPPPWFKLPELEPLAPTCANAKTPVVVIGGGLAGCHTAYELATRGIEVMLIDALDNIAGGASGNTAGIVKPFVTRSPCLADHFYRAAFHFLLERFAENKQLAKAAQFTQCGVLQLLERAYPKNNAYFNCSAQQASELSGIQINSPAIFFNRAGWLNPAAFCRQLVQHKNIIIRLQHSVSSITKTNKTWTIAFENKNGSDDLAGSSNNSIECRSVILANGAHLNKFHPTHELPITAARGQTSRFTSTNAVSLKTVVTGKRYAIPDDRSVIAGASFIRDNQDTQLRNAEHTENLNALNAMLPSLHIEPTAQSGFCATRATTPDRLPMVGPVPEFSSYRQDYAQLNDGLPEYRFPSASYQQGLYVIGGFGSRGIVSAPFCAKLLVDFICGSLPSVNDGQQSKTSHLSSWATLTHPGRFMIRELKRTRRQ